jgi:hypothetical protein
VFPPLLLKPRRTLCSHPEVPLATEGSAFSFELSFRELHRAAICSPAFTPQRKRSVRAKKTAQRLGILAGPALPGCRTLLALSLEGRFEGCAF